MTRSSHKNATTTDPNYSQFLELLRSKDQFVQIKAAKDFYQFLLSELKQAKRDDETSYVDNLMKDIKDMANEHNQNMKDKQACIYMITAIINLDNINVKVRKKHSTSLFRILRNVMAYNDPTIIHMASRAMCRYVQAGVDCEVEFKSGLESLKIENKRYQGIQLLRELVLAYPPRLFLHSSTFFENILYSICDPSSQIRYESIELFRLALAEAFKKEAPMLTTTTTGATTTSNITSSPSSASLNQSMRRTSTTSSFNTVPEDPNNGASSSSSLFHNTPSKPTVSNDKSNSELEKCFMRSLVQLKSLVDEASGGVITSSSGNRSSLPRDDQIHGYLLVTLEIVRFACLEFEQRVENYLSTYNLHYQELEQSLNNLTTSLFLNSNVVNSNYYNLTNGIENTARTCEEMHSLNLLKLLPDSSFDSFQANDQFTFLFKSEKIKVNVESEFCKRLVSESYDKMCQLCLSCVRVLNLVSLSASMQNAAPSISSSVPSPRCILDTVLEILPRLANFNPHRFASVYLSDVLHILSTLNANTQFITTHHSTVTSSASSLSLSSPLSPSPSTTNINPLSRRNLFAFMNSSSSSSNLASLANNSPTNTTTNTATSSTTASTTHGGSSTNSNQVIPSNVTSSMGTLKSQITFCVGFLSLALVSVQNEEFNTFTRNLLEQIKTSPVLSSSSSNQIGGQNSSTGLSANDRKEQINEMNSIMACVAMLSNSSSRCEIESIISLIRALMHCSGGITFTMRYFLNEITQHMSELKELVIHENLLEILSQILTGLSHDRLIQTISRSADLLTQSNLAKQADQIISKTPELSDTTVQALQTLRSFEFSSIYIIAFLPYFVYYYLQSESRLIKIETVLTVTNLLGKLISKLNENDSRSLVSIISCVIRKILICAITDPEPDVRYHVLNSLNSNPQFDMFISLPEDLNILFMCVRDERVETRELSATMISRLSTTNSAYILPFIRKILMQLLTEIDIYPDIAQREKSVRLMGHLLSHATRLVSLYIKPLLDCLHSKLNEFRHDISFASSTVTVVGQLASQSSPESIQYFDVIIPFLIESMQNYYYVKLKNMSLWALGQIIANTGYVIEPYKKYPNLLEILLGFLQNETSIQIRRETIRILGLLGAIDPFEYKKALLKNKESEIEVAAELAAQQIQQQLMLKNAAEANTNENGNAAANNNNQNAAGAVAGNNNLLVLANLQPGVTAAAQASAITANLNNNDQMTQDPIEILITTNSLEEYYPALAINFMMKTIKNSPSLTTRKDTIQALVFAVKSLDTKCINYVEHIIPPFLDLINSTNDDLANDFITRLGSLINLIKKPIEPYLNSILNIFEKYWSQHGKSQPKMIGSLIDLVQNILNVMDIEFKYYLPRVLPLILKQLKSELYAISSPPSTSTNDAGVQMNAGGGSTTAAIQNVQKILALLRSCSCCLENYINLVLVQFAEYLTSKDIKNTKIKQDLMFTIHAFAKQISLGDNCALLFHCFVRILESHDSVAPAPPSKEILNTIPLLNKSIKSSSHSSDQSFDAQTSSNEMTSTTITLSPPQQQPPVFSVSYLLFLNSKNGTNTLTNEPLENTTDLATLTLESLYLLARQLGHKYFVFASVVDNILIKSKNYSKLHEQLITNSREACFFMYWNNLKLITDGQVEKRAQAVVATPAASESKKPTKTINFGPIKVCVDQVEQLLSRESWRDSFKKFMSAVVAETPVPTLETCSLIPYDTVPTDIFNAAFISVWIKLSQYEQDFIIKYLNSALKNSNVPEIIKIILNLVEFIERCDVNYFLPLDYRLLAEKASQIKAYAKAIHYIEEQIHAIQAASTMSSSLISASAASTYNGVGGVLGAGGGGGSGTGSSSGNSSVKTIYGTMTSMSQQQQQQTLIYLLEQLVTLNHELQQTEAAEGVLDFSSKYLKTLDSQSRVKIRWYEKLHAWQKALNIYEKELSSEQLTLEIWKTSGTNQSAFLIGDNAMKVTEQRLDLILGRMRCLKGLGDWQRLNLSCNDLLKVLNNLESGVSKPPGHARQTSSLINSPSTSNYMGDVVMINPSHIQRSSADQDAKSFFHQLSSSQRTQLKEKISEIGAAACWGLGDWDQMKDYVNNLPENNYEGSLYLCVLSLASGNSGNTTTTNTVNSRIEKTRDLLDNDLTSMVSQSYERSYQGIIEAQILVELEEVLKFKQAPFKRDWIEDIWWRRLQGCERSFEHWHRLLLVRSIVLPKEKDIRTWLKFSSLCQKTNHLSLSQHILNSLLKTEETNNSLDTATSTTTNGGGLNQQSLNTLRNLEICKYVYYKSLYANDRKTEAYEQLGRLVSTSLKPELTLIQNYQLLQQQQQHLQQQYAMNNQSGGTGMNQSTASMVNFQQQNLQFPAYFQQMNPRDLQKRRVELETRLAKCYLKMGQWCSELSGFDHSTMNEIIAFYEQAYSHNRESYKAWQAWAYANFEAIKLLRNSPNNRQQQQPPTVNAPVDLPQEPAQAAAALIATRNLYVRPAILGFLNCIKISSSSSSSSNKGTAQEESNCLQDTLCLLTLWFDYCNTPEIFEVLNAGIRHTPIEIWLQVIPQLIARIDTNKQYVATLIHNLLTEIGRVHPQALVYKLILASKLGGTTSQYNILHGAQPAFDPAQVDAGRNTPAVQILKSLRETNQTLVEQARLVSEELIRVAILWNEMWHESLEEASKYYFGEKNTQAMLEILESLHCMMDRGATTNKETAFLHAYGRDLGEARQFCREYLATNNVRHIELAWEKYYSVFKRLTKQIPQMTSLELSLVSPKLMESRDLELAVPGTYQPNRPLIKIKAFNPNIQIFGTKQRPRKISMFGSNGFEYVFLLKGHEDLRQDERVMQIFGLVNNLLLKNNETARRDLAIQRYNVIPLSQNTGLLQWLLNCDTLHSLIREYREKKRLLLNLEHKIITRLAPAYDHLPTIQKVQIFEMAIEGTSGNDLAEILWHKSLNAEKWLERRTNYTRSLAVMSMVGYVLGLGDRHPSNLMLDRVSGKIIHIDFGDCFETAMTREKFPEKIPFRLTRMLKNAMEVTGIEGTFRRTCESVMKVLRLNRDSVMAVLEAFVYDPLVYWRLVEATTAAAAAAAANAAPNAAPPPPVQANQRLNPVAANNEGNVGGGEETEEMNRRAILVLNRVKDKLAGTDFRNVRPIDEATQVDLLIKQATSSENLCQCFIGWCAWW